MSSLRLSASNSLALYLLILGKVLGVAGLVVASFHRPLGALLLVLDGVCLVAAIAITLRQGRKQQREAEDDKAVIARLVREGALKQYLQEIEEEKRARPDDPEG